MKFPFSRLRSIRPACSGGQGASVWAAAPPPSRAARAMPPRAFPRSLSRRLGRRFVPVFICIRTQQVQARECPRRKEVGHGTSGHAEVGGDWPAESRSRLAHRALFTQLKQHPI